VVPQRRGATADVGVRHTPLRDARVIRRMVSVQIARNFCR